MRSGSWLSPQSIMKGQEDLEANKEDFPGGTVDKSPPASAKTWIQSLVQEDPTCHGVTKAHARQLLESESSRAWEPQFLSLSAMMLKPACSSACAPQQEKPPRWEARDP